MGVLGLLERGDDGDDHPHLELLAGETGRVGILVRQPHLPFAESAVTARAADPAPRRAKREISSRPRSNPAAFAEAIASAAKPEALAPSPMFDGKSFSDAMRNRRRIEAFARIGSTTERIRSMSCPITSRPSIVA